MPQRLPGLKGATMVLAVYAVVWIALEGDLGRVVLLAVATTVVGVGHLLQLWLGGRSISLAIWLLLAAALGSLAGFSSGMLTLVFMALKTGLHAHGPEFGPSQIGWVLTQLPWWTSAGLVAGLGLGLIASVIVGQR